MKKAQINPEIALKIFVWIVIIMAVLGFSSGAINKITEWFIPIFISLILSLVAGQIIEAFGGGFLKAITINVPIWKFNFPLSLFTLLVLVIKYGLLK
jgi:hypothetical protein